MAFRFLGLALSGIHTVGLVKLLPKQVHLFLLEAVKE